jgi:hypothetical protein
MRTRQLQQPRQPGAPCPGRAAGGVGALAPRFLVLALVAAGTLLPGSAARADFISATLGSAGPSNWAILSTGSGTDFALNGPGTTVGNVGVGGTGNLQLNSSNATAIIGNVYLSTGASLNNPNQVTGSVFTNQNAFLSHAATDARNAATTFAALAATNSTTAIGNSTGTINGTAGVNVLKITGLNLSGKVTLSAPAGGQFVINDSGGFTLNSGQIDLAGRLTASDVVFNLTGSGPDVHTSGGLNNESVINGIVLAEDRSLEFAPGLVNGEVITDSNHLHFVSGASVNQATPPPGPLPRGTPTAPEPASVVLLGLGLPALLAYAYRARRPLPAPEP